MNRILPFTTVFAAFAAALPLVVAADDSAKPEAAAEAPAAAPAKVVRTFFSLLRCSRIEQGGLQVQLPGAKDWVAAEEGRYYPCGSSFRGVAVDKVAPKAVIAFGPEATVTLDSPAEFGTREIEIGTEARALLLKQGKIALALPRSLKPGLFTVAAPWFACDDLAGDSVFEYTACDDGDEALVRVVTGTLAMKGANWSVPRMGAADRLRVRSGSDNLFTSLRCESGDFKVVLDRGVLPEQNFETGEKKFVAKTLEYALSPKCAVKIDRLKASAKARVAVSVMTFDAVGAIKNRYAFVEGSAEANSGELVVAPREVKDADAKAKEQDKAAADAEAVEVTPAAEEGEGKKPAAEEAAPAQE